MLYVAGLALLTLAFANGANDNPKPVATLVGAGLASPRRALLFGTIATAVGSGCALLLGTALVARFSSKGIVGAELASSEMFQLAVACGAAGTVLLASRLALPISTTHALVGSIAGAGLASGGIQGGHLASAFALPLLISPVLALGVTAIAYPCVHWLRLRLGITRESCVCIGNQWVPAAAAVPAGPAGADLPGTQAFERTSLPILSVGDPQACRDRYAGDVVGVSVQGIAGLLHWASALAISFSRGLQDGAKIAGIGLILLGTGLSIVTALGVTVAMAAGGLIAGRRVGNTMSTRITSMNDGQALLANVSSTALILGASVVGMPVSTTHVTTGALIGIRAHTQGPAESWLGRVLLSWVATLPLAACIAAAVIYLG